MVVPAGAFGSVALFNISALTTATAPLYYVDVKGYLPDHLEFAPNGAKLCVAIEGEPTTEGDWNDPVGGVTVIDHGADGWQRCA